MYNFKHTCPTCKGTSYTVSATGMFCGLCQQNMNMESLNTNSATIISYQNRLLEIQGSLIDSLRTELAELKKGRNVTPVTEPKKEDHVFSEAVCGPFRRQGKQKEVNEKAVITLYRYANEIERGQRNVRMMEISHEVNTNIANQKAHIAPFNQNAALRIEFHRSGVTA